MIQFSVEVRNGRANATRDVTGPSPSLLIFDGEKPANTAAPLADNPLLLTIPLPIEWLSLAVGGMVGSTIVWQGNAEQKGTGRFFRIVGGQGLCHMQGTVSEPGMGGDMEIDSVSIGLNQLVKVETFALTEPHA